MEPDQASIRLALAELVEALRTIEVRALFMGGLATLAQSRPRPTDDLDLFVHPEDACDLLHHLETCGFETEETDPRWLYKAFRHGVLVDLVFRSSGDIYLDDEMLEHATELEVKGETLRLVSPEDLAVIKAIATAEHSAHHWYDALAIIARHDLDWDYLLERARRHGPVACRASSCTPSRTTWPCPPTSSSDSTRWCTRHDRALGVPGRPDPQPAGRGRPRGGRDRRASGGRARGAGGVRRIPVGPATGLRGRPAARRGPRRVRRALRHGPHGARRPRGRVVTELVRVAAVGDLHIGRDLVDERLSVTSDDADALLLAGDLTRRGTVDEVECLMTVLSEVEVPIVAVLGNHDHHAGTPDEVRAALESAGVTVLEREATVLRIGDVEIAVVGAKGFGGGFAGRCATEFGEDEMKRFVAHTRSVAADVQRVMEATAADVRIVLYHYSPIADTLMGEPLEIYPFLGSYLLAEAVDHAGGAALVVHGHAHAGTERGRTPGGTPVRNVARPVIRRSYRVFDIHVAGNSFRPLSASAVASPR